MHNQHLIESECPLTELKGVGPQTVLKLNDLGIHSLTDIVLHLPYRYEDESIVDINTAADGEKITVAGEVYSSPQLSYFGRSRSKTAFHMLVNQVAVRVEFFNQPYIKHQVVLGETVTVTGKWQRSKQIIQGSKFSATVTDSSDKALVPQYSLKGQLKPKQFQKLVAQALSLTDITPMIPDDLAAKYKLWDLKQAVETLHFPADDSSLKQAKRTFAFCELFLFQLKMRMLNMKEHQTGLAVGINYDIDAVKAFIETLPFELTEAQKKSVNEIFRDIKLPLRMNRLLQGDVGSGKTVVAAIAMYALMTAGYQSALMVPTEILAEQHAESLAALYKDSCRIALLTSSVKGRKRRLLLEQLAAGEIDMIVGTHALIQDEVRFNRLGLVITDEQHRFGVNQRKRLREKGEEANVLFMTATPIPRTLAISVFGEMDVTTIREMPKGRKPIITSWAKHEEMPIIYQRTADELKKGRQAYVICPLIEASEKLDVQNTVAVYEEFCRQFGAERVGLLHGRMSSEEKDAVMERFSRHEISILVSTTVVEVGVNVPNATMMIIIDAERFGLSTLHQLRGRVGRSDQQSYCLLISNPSTETGIERMQIMCQTTDGFVLSEKDLEMRGPGDFFGVKQSGLPDFKVADIVEDYRMLEVARDEAAAMILSGAIDRPENSGLKNRLQLELNTLEID
ncbi:ATP-dependent DNA helicase RecG [Macrococcus equipercicus]|uniref:ATP-dependent DNA helicase RecG n=1 Tax=Macrococcus equipercicus TaxID=69967 RepID=A0A9Q9BUZ5_9STAP|nr:ATP-dependent DNA helicase RecG [Macrococcus equipercicus]KAA1042765.1 ATP-dependent DNA helicase RecG [Macrococcus equipercicus]UTH14631.1 ATP-dependent DNA helicase RecG [Macrococcus equipercicus]